MTKPRVSVLMPARNVERYIGEAIASLLSQSLSKLEVIVVDDSDDRTPAILGAFDDPRLIVVAGPRRGVSEALNIGLARARAS